MKFLIRMDQIPLFHWLLAVLAYLPCTAFTFTFTSVLTFYIALLSRSTTTARLGSSETSRIASLHKLRHGFEWIKYDISFWCPYRGFASAFAVTSEVKCALSLFRGAFALLRFQLSLYYLTLYVCFNFRLSAPVFTHFCLHARYCAFKKGNNKRHFSQKWWHAIKVL